MISYISKKGRSNLQICEDSLTAAVFDGLKYLPTEIFYSILKNALYQDKLPKNPGELLEVLFWDKWDATNTTNSTYVEPDILMKFDDLDIILEAKRYDNFQQNHHQMKDQIISYYNENDDDKKLYFVQLGGLHNTNDEKDFLYENRSITILKTNWTRIMNEVIKKIDDFSKVELSQAKAYLRILMDIKKGLELHHFYAMKWFSDIDIHPISDYNFNTMNFLNLKNETK